MREKRREAERDHNDGGNDDVKDRDRKRRRRDDDHKEERECKVSSRWREDSVDNSVVKKVDENSSDKKDVRTHEEYMEEEQRKLDDEKEKRRRIVQEWQEKKRKMEESEREQSDEPKSGKTWTLEGESDDEEAAPVENEKGDMDVDDNVKPNIENGDVIVNGSDTVNGGDNHDMGEEEIDPLDAFMNSMVIPEVNKLIHPGLDQKDSGQWAATKKEWWQIKINKIRIQIIPMLKMMKILWKMKTMKHVKKTKVEKLLLVDHSKIPLRKNFYIEVKEIQKMSVEEVAVYRKQHGKDVLKPIKTGLATKILETIRKLNYDKPMPIQTQALPIIMSGRDCIGVAAFADQPPLMTNRTHNGTYTSSICTAIYGNSQK